MFESWRVRHCLIAYRNIITKTFETVLRVELLNENTGSDVEKL